MVRVALHGRRVRAGCVAVEAPRGGAAHAGHGGARPGASLPEGRGRWGGRSSTARPAPAAGRRRHPPGAVAARRRASRPRRRHRARTPRRGRRGPPGAIPPDRAAAVAAARHRRTRGEGEVDGAVRRGGRAPAPTRWARRQQGAGRARARAPQDTPAEPPPSWCRQTRRRPKEEAPTWHARDVAIERARRAGVPCVLISPCPSLEALAAADRVIEPSRSEERAGWPILDVVDRRQDDPRSGLYSPRLVDTIRRHEGTGGALHPQPQGPLASAGVSGVRGGGALRTRAMPPLYSPRRSLCERCGTERPVLCIACGSTALRNLRVGVGASKRRWTPSSEKAR